MTTKRRHIQPASPNLTAGDDHEQPTCPAPLQLIDAVYSRGHAGAKARERILIHCPHCPLRDNGCWDNKEWRDALRETPGDAA